MRRGVKIFGTFNGISPEAFQDLEDFLEFDEVSYDDGTVLIEHDDPIDEEFEHDVVTRVMEAMEDGFESSLDIINHEEDLITRYVIEADGFRAREFNINDVVQPYPNAQA